MLSPKMQRSVRVNENQLIMLSDKAQYDHSMVSAFLFRSLSLVLLAVRQEKSCKAAKNRSFCATSYLQTGAQVKFIFLVRGGFGARAMSEDKQSK